ncbi:MAG: DUF4386 domain-containing protein [Anaerolineales bacterium]|nr:DUF4386 domain-containing protein [Anaerolineales bacterium]
MNRKNMDKLSLKTAVIVAGLALLGMAILAGYANFAVLQTLIVPGYAKTTAENIVGSPGAFRLGAFLLLVVAILDVVVAWGLYVLLMPTNKMLSLLTAWFRIVYAAIFAIASSNLFTAVQLLTGSHTTPALETNLLHGQVMVLLNAFQNGWDAGLLIFGLHLAGLGYLAFQSGYIPKWLGILLLIAGLGYMIDSVSKLLIPDNAIFISQFTFVGEVVLIFWLLWKGSKGFPSTIMTSHAA